MGYLHLTAEHLIGEFRTLESINSLGMFILVWMH